MFSLPGMAISTGNGASHGPSTAAWHSPSKAAPNAALAVLLSLSFEVLVAFLGTLCLIFHLMPFHENIMFESL